MKKLYYGHHPRSSLAARSVKSLIKGNVWAYFKAYRLFSIQGAVELISEEMKILSEVKLPIYPKSQWIGWYKPSGLRDWEKKINRDRGIEEPFWGPSVILPQSRP